MMGRMSDPTNVLRILFMGAGAVGQGVGGFLAAAGHEVALVLRPRYRDALARQGLRVEGIFGDRHVHPDRLTLATDPAELAGRQFDAVVITVKSHDTPAAAEAAAPLVGPTTAVVSMQNGYGNVEHLADRFGTDRVLCARVITGFSIPEPGRVVITVHADAIRIGSFYRPHHPMAERLAAAIDDAGLPAKAADDVEAVLWGKILYNCALNPLGAILGVHYGALADSPQTRAVMDAIIDEAFAVIDAHGFRCLWPSADAFREAFYGRQIPPTYDHRPSMLQDLAAGRRTEIDALNGALVRLAAEKDIPAPINQTIVRLVHFLEAHAAH